MYHRVAEPAFDPSGLCVSPERFRQQMEMLKAERTPVSMEELVAGLKTGKLPPYATAVTFDDGSADNVLTAKPILDALGVPGTLFLTTGFVGTNRLYWWNALAHLVLASPQAADFDFRGKRRSSARNVGRAEKPARFLARLAERRHGWRGGQRSPPGGVRPAVGGLQTMSPDAREDTLDRLRNRIGGSAEQDAAAIDRPMALRWRAGSRGCDQSWRAWPHPCTASRAAGARAPGRNRRGAGQYRPNDRRRPSRLCLPAWKSGSPDGRTGKGGRIRLGRHLAL